MKKLLLILVLPAAAACYSAGDDRPGAAEEKHYEEKAEARAAACKKLSARVDNLISIGALEAPSPAYSRKYHLTTAAWRELTVRQKENLASALLKYHQCERESGAQFIEIYGLYSGKRLARYGSHRGLKLY